MIADVNIDDLGDNLYLLIFFFSTVLTLFGKTQPEPDRIKMGVIIGFWFWPSLIYRADKEQTDIERYRRGCRFIVHHNLNLSFIWFMLWRFVVFLSPVLQNPNRLHQPGGPSRKTVLFLVLVLVWRPWVQVKVLVSNMAAAESGSGAGRDRFRTPGPAQDAWRQGDRHRRLL